MYQVWLHRYATFLAFCTLLLVVAGGLVTSNDAGLSVPDWPLSYGQLMPPLVGNIRYEHGHRMVATFVGLLTIGMAVWLWRTERRVWMRRLGLAALAAVITQGLLGGMTVIFMLPKPVSISHAVLAELFFSTTVAIALFTSQSWHRPMREVEDERLPWLAAVAAGGVLAQVALGAAARHQALGILPHIGGAFIATAMVLRASLRVLMRHPEHPALRRSAVTVLCLVFLQVFLGIAAYMSRLAAADALESMAVMIGFTVAHVAVGAMTLAASVVLAVQVFHNVRPRTAEFAGVPVAL